MIQKIISDGETGADQAALDAAIELGIDHGGWVPKGRTTEGGILPDIYDLDEMLSYSYSEHIEQNIIDSHGTVIFSHDRLNGRSAYAKEMAIKHRRPYLHIDLDDTNAFEAAVKINGWIYRYNIGLLNVAGTRGSKDPKIYIAVKTIIKVLIRMDNAGISNVNSFEKEIINPPRTVEEAVDTLINKLPLKDKTMIAKMEEYDLSDLSLSLGMYIRKNFKLLTGNIALLKSCEAIVGRGEFIKEGAAIIIILELWKKLKESHGLRVVK